MVTFVHGGPSRGERSVLTRMSVGRRALRLLIVAAIVAAGTSGAHAEQSKPVQPAPQPKPVQIDRNGVLILVRGTLLALDHANKTGNYSVLRDLGAPAFQVNNPARLAEIFAVHRRDDLDLSGVSVIEPQLTLLPQIEANGMMRMAGFFPSVPKQVNFELAFAPVSGQWRLFGISVATPQVPAQPPQAEAPKNATPAKKK